MRQLPVKCNQELVRAAVRLDGRAHTQHRPLSIGFGPEHGSCIAAIGNSKVLTQISASVAEPRLTRPCEGIVNIRVDLTPLGQTNYDTSRSSDECVQLTRLLHKGIKDARCLDLESLCIVSGERVWHIQVDVVCLNHDGNLIEAASVSTLAALAHFRRPSGEGTDDDLAPLSLLHHPFLMKFAFFKQASVSYVDPSEDEERLCDGYLIVGANANKDITLVHVAGKSLISKEQILAQCNYAVKRTRALNDEVNKALGKDEQERQVARKEGKFYKGNIYEVLAKTYC